VTAEASAVILSPLAEGSVRASGAGNVWCAAVTAAAVRLAVVVRGALEQVSS
jgi:hypothetical protein